MSWSISGRRFRTWASSARIEIERGCDLFDRGCRDLVLSAYRAVLDPSQRPWSSKSQLIKLVRQGHDVCCDACLYACDRTHLVEARDSEKSRDDVGGVDAKREYEFTSCVAVGESLNNPKALTV